jgi:hypothetical protein
MVVWSESWWFGQSHGGLVRVMVVWSESWWFGQSHGGLVRVMVVWSKSWWLVRVMVVGQSHGDGLVLICSRLMYFVFFID